MNWRMLVIGGVLSGGIIGAVAANDITVISFGRADQAALTKAYFRPFHDGAPIASLKEIDGAPELHRNDMLGILRGNMHVTSTKYFDHDPVPSKRPARNE